MFSTHSLSFTKSDALFAYSGRIALRGSMPTLQCEAIDLELPLPRVSLGDGGAPWDDSITSTDQLVRSIYLNVCQGGSNY
jgi:hypothetical protein